MRRLKSELLKIAATLGVIVLVVIADDFVLGLDPTLPRVAKVLIGGIALATVFMLSNLIDRRVVASAPTTD